MRSLQQGGMCGLQDAMRWAAEGHDMGGSRARRAGCSRARCACLPGGLWAHSDPLLNKPFYPNGLVTGILTWCQKGLRRVRLGERSWVRIPMYAHVGRCRCAFAWGVMGAL
ncbi:unnamed protein product [Closterium sp. NIES-54]